MQLTWRHFSLAAILAASVVGACSSFSGTDGNQAADSGGSDSASAAADGAIDKVDGSANGTDAGDVVDGAGPASRKRVFVTSTVTNAAFGEIQPAKAAADQLCAQAAVMIADAGMFKAWVSDGVNVAGPPAPGPYYDVTGNVLVFAKGGGFSSSGLRSELNLEPPASWWTGMASPTQIGDTCNRWLGDASYAAVGKATSWFGGDGSAESPCMGGFAGILCFEQ